VSADHVSRAANRGHHRPSGQPVFLFKTKFKNKIGRNSHERELRRNLGLNRNKALCDISRQKFLNSQETSMTDNMNLSNEIILIEELEPKTAPSGIWDVVDLPVRPGR
jgi:hypothetical protein